MNNSDPYSKVDNRLGNNSLKPFTNAPIELARHIVLDSGRSSDSTAKWVRINYILFAGLVQIAAFADEIKESRGGRAQDFRAHLSESLEDKIASDIREAQKIWQVTTNNNARQKRYYTSILISSLETAHRWKDDSRRIISADRQTGPSPAAIRFLEDNDVKHLANCFEQFAHLSLLRREQSHLKAHTDNHPSTVFEGIINLISPPRLVELAKDIAETLNRLIGKHSDLFGSVETHQKSREELQGITSELNSLACTLSDTHFDSGIIEDTLAKLVSSKPIHPSNSLASHSDNKIKSSNEIELSEIRELLGNLAALISLNTETSLDYFNSAIKTPLANFYDTIQAGYSSIDKKIGEINISISSTKMTAQQVFSTANSQSPQELSCGEIYAINDEGILVQGITKNEAVRQISMLKHEVVRAAQKHFALHKERIKSVHYYHCIIYDAVARALIENRITDISGEAAKKLFEKMILLRNPSYEPVISWQIDNFKHKINNILAAIIEFDDDTNCEEVPF